MWLHETGNRGGADITDARQPWPAAAAVLMCDDCGCATTQTTRFLSICLLFLFFFFLHLRARH